MEQKEQGRASHHISYGSSVTHQGPRSGRPKGYGGGIGASDQRRRSWHYRETKPSLAVAPLSYHYQSAPAAGWRTFGYFSCEGKVTRVWQGELARRAKRERPGPAGQAHERMGRAAPQRFRSSHSRRAQRKRLTRQIFCPNPAALRPAPSRHTARCCPRGAGPTSCRCKNPTAR